MDMTTSTYEGGGAKMLNKQSWTAEALQLQKESAGLKISYRKRSTY
jgi:hypothetical protein